MKRAFSVLLLLCGGPAAAAAAAAAAVEATGFNPPIPDGPIKPTSRPKRDKHAKFWETARAAERDERRKHTGRKKKVRPSTDSKGSGAESGAADPLEVPDATASNADRGALRAAANEAKRKARTAARAEKLEIAKAKRAVAKRESDDMHASWCDDATHAGSVLCEFFFSTVDCSPFVTSSVNFTSMYTDSSTRLCLADEEQQTGSIASLPVYTHCAQTLTLILAARSTPQACE